MQSAKKNMSHFGNAHKQSCWMIINNNNAWRKVIFMFPRCFPLYDPKPLYGDLQSQKFAQTCYYHHHLVSIFALLILKITLLLFHSQYSECYIVIYNNNNNVNVESFIICT